MPALLVSLLLLLTAVVLAGDADAPLVRLGAEVPVVLPAQGPYRLELAGGSLAAPLTLSGELTVLGDIPGRRLTGHIITAAPVPVPLQACFIARSLRNVTEDDWRGSQRIAGRRTDQVINLGGTWGSPAERRAWGIAGNDQNWDNVSVQYDGWIHVEVAQVDLATVSDDGSRLWLDRDGDGRIGAGEWGGNGWGSGHAAATVVVHAAVPRGVYRFRLQAEESNGDSRMTLLWSDEQRGAGRVGGLQVVPESSFAQPRDVVLAGHQPLVLAANIAGPGGLIVNGPAVRWAPGAACSGPLWLQGGTLRLDADLEVPDLVIEAGAALEAAGHRVRVGRLRAVGRISLAGGTLECTANAVSDIAAIAGDGVVRISGGAQVRIRDPGTVRFEIEDGAALLPDRALSAGRMRPASSLGAELPLALPGQGPFNLVVDLDVPGDAPADLGILAYARDRHDSWHQRAWPEMLHPGRQRLTFHFGADDPVFSAAGDAPWNADRAALCERAGLRLWSVQGGGGAVGVQAVATAAARAPLPPSLGAWRSDGAVLVTGRRWELACRPEPFPADPYDPAEFALDAEFSGPGGVSEQVAGFHMQAGTEHDGGDRVLMRSEGLGEFRLRWRPRLPGAWRCRLTARWRSGATASCELPLSVEGPAWDDYLRVDETDRRFFSVGGAFAWPVGVNLHAVSDERSREALGTRPTPQRGILAYHSYIDRFAGAGADLAEVWMAAWNFGLEWGAHRPGYAGAGRYNQGNAAQLDALLDHAQARGMRLILAVNHLGQGSDWCAPEWDLHPYNRATGGWLEQAADLFTDPRALDFQERYRRYVIARWGDHPAVACWKLWTEVDLTNMHANTVPWHKRASTRWHQLDPYRHPVTTHWSGIASPAVIALPGIDFPTINAYHLEGTLLAEVIGQNTLDPVAGLARRGKPVLTTEYGLNWFGGSREQLLAEAASAPFAGLVTGHAGAPMCWWFERLDQDATFGGYRAVRAFAAGEDLRGPAAHSRRLLVQGPGAGEVWAQAWSRPGRLLGYALDRNWGSRGGESAQRSGIQLILSGGVAAGAMQLEWWDADRGTVLERQSIAHPGGTLTLTAPPWQRHIACKLWRE